MRKQNVEAVILRNFQFKDADKIYTLLTKNNGKISAIAKGVRKISSRRSGNLDTLNQIAVQLNEHKSGQMYISEVKTLNSFKELKEDYQLSKLALYMAEIVNKSIWEDEYTKEVYDLMVRTLQLLNKDTRRPILLVNKFEINFMKLLGYQPPKELLLAWKKNVEEKDYTSADLKIKNFVQQILEENIKSLELD